MKQITHYMKTIAVVLAFLLSGTISAQCPPANFTFVMGSNGQVTFSNTTVGTNSATAYSWNFGNGSVGSGPVAMQTYTANGTYPVSLTYTSWPGPCIAQF